MSSKEVGTPTPARRRWMAQLIIIGIALVLSIVIVLFFFTSGAVSH